MIISQLCECQKKDSNCVKVFSNDNVAAAVVYCCCQSMLNTLSFATATFYCRYRNSPFFGFM